MKKRITAITLMVVMLFSLTACLTETTPPGAEAEEVVEITQPAPQIDISKDREGNAIVLPDVIETIISLGPSNTEIISSLGFGEQIIATDTYSAGIGGVAEDIPQFDMWALDIEQILNLEPDVIFVTGMSKVGGIDPFETVHDTGICVVYIPTSASIEGIMDDIRFIAAVLGADDVGALIIDYMEGQIEQIAEIGASITDKKTVYFEIEAAPYMYSFGTGVFLNQMIEIAGGVNILGDIEGWTAVSDESVLDSNPNVILTSVNYVDDPVAEIKQRPGWDEISAVKNGEVYYIDTDASNRPSHNVIKALRQIAEAMYPDLYK